MKRGVIGAVFAIVLLVGLVHGFPMWIKPSPTQAVNFFLSEKYKNLPFGEMQRLMNCPKESTVTLTQVSHGDVDRYVSIPGIVHSINLTIHGSGTMLGVRHVKEWIPVNNGTTINLNLSYYPRNITLQIIGYSWWNNTNQKIVNNTGVVISDSPISEVNGSFSVTQTYSVVDPIWQSKGADIIVDTTNSVLAWDNDSIAGTQSIIYNITINDGTFTSLTWLNTSCYVAPNTSLGTGQDDIAIYYSTDGGATWNPIFIAANGATSPGIQWTGTHNLPIAGNKSVLINVTFISDGADDLTTGHDICLGNLELVGTVSKIPTRNPCITVDGKEYSDNTGITGMANGSVVTYDLGNLGMNLTNTIHVYCEGSQKVGVRLMWNDENRTCFKLISFDGKTWNTSLMFLDENQSKTYTITDVTHGVLPLIIEIDPHTTTQTFTYQIEAKTNKYQIMIGSQMEVGPDGVSWTSENVQGEPLPIYVMPDVYGCSCNVIWWNPNTQSPNSSILKMNASSVHGNTVWFIVSGITSNVRKVSLFVDGKQVEVLPVKYGTVVFPWSNWSSHQLVLRVYAASAGVGGAPSPGGRNKLVGIAFVILGILVLAGIVYIWIGSKRDFTSKVIWTIVLLIIAGVLLILGFHIMHVIK